jgi:hypothetical protein
MNSISMVHDNFIWIFLGSPDGIEPEDQPTIYRGDISSCSSSNLPLY